MKRTPVDMLTARELELPLPLSRRSLEERQLQRLRRTIAHVKEHSPFYRSHLQHISADDIHSLNDLAKLPFLQPAQLISAGESILGLSQTAIKRIVSLPTSGSTGQPKQIYYTKSDLEATRRFFHDGMQSLITEQDRVLVLLPYSQDNSVGRLLIEALSRESIHCGGYWPVEPERVGGYAGEQNISCLVGLPQHLLETAHHLSLFRGESERCAVRSMLLCSDYTPSSLRTRITELCGAETFLHWGSTETGLGGAVECELHDGCHLRESQLIIEIIDPETGLRQPDGAIGEIVVTTINREGMVLLRYRSGDLGGLIKAGCPCGGVTARLVRITGRNIHHRMSDTTITSQEIDDHMFALPDLLDFRVELNDLNDHRDGELTIHYRTACNSTCDDAAIRSQLRNIESIKQAEMENRLKLVAKQVTDLTIPSHTFKRSISDNRSR